MRGLEHRGGHAKERIAVQTSAPNEQRGGASRARRRYEHLPGPRGLPVIGNALQFDSGRAHLQMEQWSREFGPYFRLRNGPRRMLVVADHEAVASVLRDRPDGFRRTSRLEEIWVEMGMQPGVFGANGETWRRQRRMVMAGFDPAHVKSYFPALRGVAQRLATRWQRCAAQCDAIDLQADLMRYTVDTIAGLAFGSEVNTLDSDDDIIQRHLDKIFPALMRRIFAPIPVWRLLRSRADRELERGVVAVNAAVDGFIAKARERLRQDPARAQQPPNLLEAMLVAADRPGSGIDDAQVAGNVLTMLLAGEDTTANTIAWMVYLLWRHPQALARASEEVRRVVADPRQPTLEETARLDYLEACAHETMRLKPVAPILALQTLHETTIGDVRVPKDIIVVTLMRRDSVSDAHVPRAAAFEPERWLVEGGPGQAASAAKRISMPFGAGPRICPGRYLALLEMKMAMATLLGQFEILGVDTPDGREALERLSFTMSPVGLRMRLQAKGAVSGDAESRRCAA
jgi:cytochrome P450